MIQIFINLLVPANQVAQVSSELLVMLLPGQPLFQGLACFLWVLSWLPEPAQPIRDPMHMCVHTYKKDQYHQLKQAAHI